MRRVTSVSSARLPSERRLRPVGASALHPVVVLVVLCVVVGGLGLADAVSPIASVLAATVLAVGAGAAVLRPRLAAAVAIAGCGVAVLVLAASAAALGDPTLVALVALVVLIGASLVPVPRRRVRPEEAEADLAARVEDLARTKDQLLAVVSHEFRTPVTGVMGVARTMSAHFDGLDDDTMRLFVDALEGHSTRLARLVENLVVASGGVETDAQASCDLHGVVGRVAATADGGGREIQVRMRGERRACIDEDAARHIVSNLIDNAVKFGDPGTPVRVAVHPLACDLALEVTNSGPPLPADLRARLYQPFVQADSSDSRRADGLGLGLHVVRRLVEAHGGRVEVADTGGLVTFRVRLRPAEADVGELGSPVEPNPVG